jgi:hypothetical protein
VRTDARRARVSVNTDDEPRRDAADLHRASRHLRRHCSCLVETIMTTSADGKLAGLERLIYLTTTCLVLAVMVFSIVNFTVNDRFPFPNGPEGAFVHLGFPGYFKVELTVVKILGVLALLIPTVPFKVKEFAYFGFAITLASASIAHFGRGEPV